MNERLKELRKYLSMNQGEFSTRIGVTRSAISRLESGDINFTEQMLKSICREFNVNRAWLVEGTGDMFVELSNALCGLAVQFNLSDIEQDAVKRFCELPKEQRFAIAMFLVNK